MDSKKILKYGDKILLRNKQEKIFFGSRGHEGQSGFYIKVPDEFYLDHPLMYPSVFELLFEIHPQLNYGAAKDYYELAENDPNKHIAKKRMILEENLNKTKLVENKDKPIYLGSMIQLFHIATRTYLQVYPQKIGDTEMGVLGASLITTEYVQFKVSLPFSLFKKGTPLNYDNSFILQDSSKRTLAFPNRPNIWSQFEMKFRSAPESNTGLGFMFFRGAPSETRFDMPFVVENQSCFKGYLAGYVNMDDVDSDNYSNDFQAVNMSGYFNKIEGLTLWGNSVVIKRMDNEGRVSMMVAESNKSVANKSEIAYRYVENIELKKVQNIESHFQIIPAASQGSGPGLLGSKIKYDSNKSINCLIKNMLTGKFLIEIPKTGVIRQAEDFEKERDMVEQNKKYIEEEYQNKISKFNENRFGPDEFNQADIGFLTNPQKGFFKNDQDYFNEYVRLMIFRLDKMSSDDDSYINNSNFFKILAPSGKVLKISDHKEPDNSPLVKDPKEDLFTGDFEKGMKKAYVTQHKLELTPKTADSDLFYFQEISMSHEMCLSKVIACLPYLCEVLDPNNKSEILVAQYTETIEKLIQIFHEITTNKKLELVEAQNLYRQASVIDLMMRFLTLTHKTSSTEMESAASVLNACIYTVALLDLVLNNNKVNCLYLFQWRNFITSAILSASEMVITKTNLDSLYFKVIDLLGYYWIYTDNFIEPLCSQIKFSNLDCHKIEILLKILGSFRTNLDEKSLDILCQNVFKSSNVDEIFKPLTIESGTAVIIAKNPFSGTNRIVLDQFIPETPQIFDYIITVFRLAVFFAEIDLLRVSKKLSQVFPEDVCMNLIEETKLPTSLRCLVLNLYSAIYILNPVYHFKIINFSNDVLIPTEINDLNFSNSKAKKDLKLSPDRKNKTKKSDIEQSPNPNILSNLNLESITKDKTNKNYLNKLLKDTNEDKSILYSSLKTIIQLLETNFFLADEMIELKERIENLIIMEEDDLHLKIDENPNDNQLLSNRAGSKVNSSLISTPGNQLMGPSSMFDDSASPEAKPAKRNKERRQSVMMIKNEFDFPPLIEAAQNATNKDIMEAKNRRNPVDDLADDQEGDEERRKIERFESWIQMLDILMKVEQMVIIKQVEHALINSKKLESKQEIKEAKLRKKNQWKLSTKSLLHSTFTQHHRQEMDTEKLMNLLKKTKTRQKETFGKILIKWLSIDWPSLFFKILEFHRQVCSQRYFLFKNIFNKYLLQTPEESNKYLDVNSCCKNLLKCVRNISREVSPDQKYLVIGEFTKIYEELKNKFLEYYTYVPKNKRVDLFESLLKDQSLFNDQLNVGGVELALGTENLTSNVLNHYMMKLDDIGFKQLKILKSGFLGLLVEILHFCNHKIFNKLTALRSLEFNSSVLFESSLFVTNHNAYNQVNGGILMLIYFGIYHNPENCKYLIENYEEKLMKLLINYLQDREPFLKKLSLLILKSIFGLRIESIYKLNKRYRSYFTSIIAAFNKESREKKTNYEILTNYLEFFQSVTIFDNILFEKNCEMMLSTMSNSNKGGKGKKNLSWLHKLIHNDIKMALKRLFFVKNGTTTVPTLSSLAEVKDFKKLRSTGSELKGKNCPECYHTEKATEYNMDDMEENDCTYRTVEMPGVLAYAIQLLKMLNNIGRLGSSEIKSKIRKLISLGSLLECFELSKELWPLKIALTDFLTYMHINQKLDLKGKSLIYQFIKESLMKDLSEYMSTNVIKKYESHIFMISEFTLISRNLLKKDRILRPCYNAISFEYRDTYLSYVKDSVTQLLKEFTLIVCQDKNEVMLTSLWELIDEKRLQNNPGVLLNTGVMGAILNNPIAMKNSYFEGSHHESMSDYRKGTHLGGRQPRDTMSSKKQDLLTSINLLFSSESGKESYHAYYQKIEIEESVALQRHIISVYPDPRRDENSFLKETREKEFQEFNLLLKNDLKAQNDRDYNMFLRQACSMLSNPQPTPSQVCLLLNYLSEQLKLSGESKDQFISKIIAFKFSKNLISMMLQRSQEKEVIMSSVCLLKDMLNPSNEEFQNELYLELFKDNDNQFANLISKYLDETWMNYVELEQLKDQFALGGIRGANFPEDIEKNLDLKYQQKIKDVIDILEMLRLTCENHFSKMQAYVRVQTIGNNVLKPYQINFVEKTITYFKTYTKCVRNENSQLGVELLNFLIEILQGPSKENQMEVIKKKLLEPLEDFHCNLMYSTYKITKNKKIEFINLVLTLKLAIIESTKEKLIIKTVAISLNMELIWTRLIAIYCDLNKIRIKKPTKPANSKPAIENSLHKQSNFMTKEIQEDNSQPNHNDIFLAEFQEVEHEKEKNGNKRRWFKRFEGVNNYPISVVEGLNSLILLKQLSEMGEENENLIEKSYSRVEEIYPILAKARKYFTDKIQSIEYLDQEGELKTLFFFIHPTTLFLSAISIQKFEVNVDRRTWSSKMNDLLKLIPKAHIEIRHNVWMHKYLGIYLTASYFYSLKLFNFALAIIVNICFVLNPNLPDEVESPKIFNDWEDQLFLERFSYVLCWMMLGFYIVALAFFMFYEFIVKLKIFLLEEKDKQIAYLRTHSTVGCLYKTKKALKLTSKVLTQTKLLVVLGLFFCSVLGFTRSKLYFSFLLLDIIELSPNLMNVIRSLTINVIALSNTWLLIIIMSFIYSSIAYFNSAIRDNMALLDQDGFVMCGNYITCFWNTLIFGIKQGGGLGEILVMPDTVEKRSDYIYRSIFDLTFFIFMILILMNIILGIIIDSFAELRDIRNKVEYDKANICFMCNISKQEFNSHAVSFTTHTRVTHYLWNYVFYIIGLLEKDPNDYSGIESYIVKKYLKKETDWLPIQQTALLINRNISEEEARDIKIASIEAKLDKLIERDAQKKVDEEN